MKTPDEYVAKERNVVYMTGKAFIRGVVVDADHENRAARVKNVEGIIGLRTAHWSVLHHLDESQNALRIIGEATENR
jgi:hypothetical protein